MARRSAKVIRSAVSFICLTSWSVRPSVAQAQRPDQPAVDHQVGIAPDRAGEVGVALQVQAEVADVVRIVLGLHLGAQDHLVDDVGVRSLAGLFQQLVEPVGTRRLALGPGDLQRRQEVVSAIIFSGDGVSWTR
jgi:hypothetical protein